MPYYLYECLYSLDESDSRHITIAQNPLEAIEKFLKAQKINLSSLIRTRYSKPISYSNCQIDYQKKEIHFHKIVITFTKLIQMMYESEYINDPDDPYNYRSDKHIFEEVNLV